MNPKQIFQRFALALTILMLGVWGVILIVSPGLVVSLLTQEPLNKVLAGMMGAALLGLAFISLASISQWMSAKRALGVAMLILVVETAYLMLGAEAMLVTFATSVSLVAAAAVAFFLLT